MTLRNSIAKHKKSLIAGLGVVTLICGSAILVLKDQRPLQRGPASIVRGPDCPDRFTSDFPSIAENTPSGRRSINVSQFETSRNKRVCQAGVSAQFDSTSRSILFQSDGAMVVNPALEGTGGRASHTSGLRVYFFFPRRTQTARPQITAHPNGNVTVQTTADEHITFDHLSGRIVDFSGVDFTEEEPRGLENRSGLEIRRYHRGILLDVGWNVGEIPQKHLQRTARFVDPSGRTCEVKNGEIFRRDANYSVTQEVFPLFETDAWLLAFLKKRCSNLDLSSLEETAAGGAAAVSAPASARGASGTDSASGL